MGVMQRDKWREFRDENHVPEGAALLTSMGKSIDRFHKDKDKDLDKAVTALEKSIASYAKAITKKYPAFADRMKKRFAADIKAERTQAEVVEAKGKLKDTSLTKVPEDRLKEQQARKADIAIKVINGILTELKAGLRDLVTDINSHEKRYYALQRARALSANIATLAKEPDYKDLGGISTRLTENSLPDDWTGGKFEEGALKAIIKKLITDVQFLERRFR